MTNIKMKKTFIENIIIENALSKNHNFSEY